VNTLCPLTLIELADIGVRIRTLLRRKLRGVGSASNEKWHLRAARFSGSSISLKKNSHGNLAVRERHSPLMNDASIGALKLLESEGPWTPAIQPSRLQAAFETVLRGQHISLHIPGLILNVLIAPLGKPPDLPLPALAASDVTYDVADRDFHEAEAITKDCRVLEKARYLKLPALHPVPMDWT
jgi:hypothetical protein